MTPTELIAELSTLAPSAIDPDLLYARILLRYLADHARDATIESGDYLSDVTTFVIWLRELAEACRNRDRLNIQSLRELRRGVTVDAVCPRCGHIHEGSAQCGVSMGKDRWCPCEMEISA